MPITYRCIKTVATLDGSFVPFAEGRLYQGKVSETPDGELITEFTSDQGRPHRVSASGLNKHFVQVPELDIMSHDELQRWLTDGPSARQLYQAIITGQEWLASFKPEMEDDNGLVEALFDRLEMIEAAYELHNG